MKHLKKTIACLLALLLMASLFALPAGAVGFTPPFEIAAPAAYVVNTDTNIIVYEKNSEEPLQAASLTKLMTVILMLEEYGDELDSVSATVSDVAENYVYIHGGSHADIRRGESRTLREMLYAMLLPSANEAALAVAELMGGGSTSNFVAMMNARARDIGCTGTTFTDPCGLDEGNITTARDMYLILRYAMSFDQFKTAANTYRYVMNDIPRYTPGTYAIVNTNKMLTTAGLNYYRDYTQGGKTGVLGEWQNFAGWHVQDGMTYITVVLNSPNSSDPNHAADPVTYKTPRPALNETGVLMDWAFDSFTLQNALDVGQPITEVPVKYATETDTLRLYPADSMYTLLPADGDGSVTQKTFHLPETVAASVKQGDVIGTVTLSLSGEVIGTVDLIAERDISRNTVLYVIEKIGEFFGSLYFRVVVVLTVIAVVLYLVWYVNYLMRRANSRKVRRSRPED